MSKLALVLPGGGACGRWQAGVIKYIQESGVGIDLICGTSVGGLNTLVTASGKDIEGLWKSITKNKDIYDGMLKFNSFFDWLGMLGQIFKDNKGKSILKPTGLYNIINKEFGFSVLSDLKIPIIITSTELNYGERVTFDSESNSLLSTAFVAKATSAIPLVFPAVPYSFKLYVDGGLGRNNPVEEAYKAGATHIIVVGTMPDDYPVRSIDNNLLNVALRSQDVIMRIFEEEAWDSIDRSKAKFLDLYPTESTGSALDFGNVEQFDNGYKAAKALGDLKAFKGE